MILFLTGKFAAEMKDMSVARAKRLRQHKALNKRLDQRAAEALDYRRGPTLENTLARDVASGQTSFPTLADNPFGFSLAGDATPSSSPPLNNDANGSGSGSNEAADVPLAKRLSHWSSVAKRGMAGNDTWVALPHATPTPAAATATAPSTTSTTSSSSGATAAKLSRQSSTGHSPAVGPLPSPLAALAAAISNVPVAAPSPPTPATPPMVAMPAPPMVRQPSGVDESRPDRVFAPLARKSDSLFGGHSPSMTPSTAPSSSSVMGSPSLGPAATPATLVPTTQTLATTVASAVTVPATTTTTRTPPMIPISTPAVSVPPVVVSAWTRSSGAAASGGPATASPASPLLGASSPPGGVGDSGKKKGGKQKTLITTGSQRAYR
jgi:hypothetical protein